MAGEDRVFNPHGRRHYRRTYSMLEVRIGLAILGGLLAVGGWVVHRGQHPDPSLQSIGAALTARTEPEPDRGPMPENLAIEGYRAGRVRHFGPDNLFEKINGRADFFKSRGFQRLTVMTLMHEDPTRSIDIELYDMGNAQNALGTYAAERSPGVEPKREAGAQYHTEPNALFMARGRFYLRASAATGEAPVGEQLARIRERVNATVEGAERPWSEQLFVDALGLPESGVGFVTENAFSFGFAKGVHTATLADGETQLFVVPVAGDGAAEALATRFLEEGFGTYGEPQTDGGQVFVTDRYLSRVSTAAAAGPFVIGVASAESVEAARTALAELREAVEALPPPVRARALPAADSGPGAAQTTDAQVEEAAPEGAGEPTYE